ncbi:hypothetical protein ACQ858_19645 [Variovorax ureilyticus]|uniref:hypothetical protein n=1 Tax=Variovorax ureilyticus TaxID=1836198 RepID=UPI003D66B4BD
MPPAESPTPDEIHGPPKPITRIPNGQPNPFYLPHKTSLAQLREEFVVSAHGQRIVLQEEADWDAMPQMLRFYALTDSGMSEPDDMLPRRWREYTDAERQAIRATLRSWLRALRSLCVLTL